MTTHEKQRAKIVDVLMTPNQAWRGMKSVPIELIWGIEQLIDSAKREVLEEMRPANATIESMRMYIPRTHTYKGKEYPACSMCGFCPEAMNAFIDAQLEQSKEEL